MLKLSSDMKFTVSIGLAVSVTLGGIGFGWNAQHKLSQINQAATDANREISEMGDKIQQVETALTARLTSFEQAMSDRFTKTAAAEWALRLVVSNPTLRIPDPRDPSRMLSESARPTGVYADWRK